MKRLLAFAAGVLMLVSCSETFNAGRLLQGGMIAAQAMSLSDEQVQAYVHQYITQLDAQSKVLPESNAYTKRLRNLTKGLTSVDGIPVVLTRAKGDVYTIQGQYVGRNLDLKRLPRGIYIIAYGNNKTEKIIIQ